MKKIFSISILLISLLLSSCVYISLPESSDPKIKLENARSYMEKGQPFPAERLIMDAMQIYETQNNPEELGSAYCDFGEFLRSDAIAQREQTYREAGFLDNSITYDNRYEKSNEYLDKAIAQYSKAADNYLSNGRFDLLSALYYRQANVYLLQNNNTMACSSYDQSRAAYAEGVIRNLSALPNIPDGYSSFHDAISAAKIKAGCP